MFRSCKKQPSTSWISTSAPQARQSSDSTPGKKFTSLTSNFLKSNHLEKISLSAIQHLGSRDVTTSTSKYNSYSLYWNSVSYIKKSLAIRNQISGFTLGKHSETNTETTIANSVLVGSWRWRRYYKQINYINMIFPCSWNTKHVEANNCNVRHFRKNNEVDLVFPFIYMFQFFNEILPSLQVHSKLHQEQTEQHNQLRTQTWLEENFIQLTIPLQKIFGKAKLRWNSARCWTREKKLFAMFFDMDTTL